MVPEHNPAAQSEDISTRIRVRWPTLDLDPVAKSLGYVSNNQWLLGRLPKANDNRALPPAASANPRQLCARKEHPPGFSSFYEKLLVVGTGSPFQMLIAVVFVHGDCLLT
jgi:hypothetical protein